MSALDYIVVAAYFLSLAVIGVVAGRRQHDTHEFFLGSRAIHWAAATASIIATAISTKSMIGLPGLSHKGGLVYLQMYLVVPLAAWLCSRLFLPVYARLGVTSAYEYLGHRFGPRTRSFGSLLFQIETAVVLGTVIAAPALVLSGMTGLGYAASVASVLVVTAGYTALGGVRAVIWADVLQVAVFVIVPAAVLVSLLTQPGSSAAEMIRAADAAGRWRLLDFSFSLQSELTVWAALTSMLIWHMSNYGVNQVLIQRYMTAESEAKSRRAMVYGSLGSVALWALFLVIGVLLFGAKYAVPANTPPDGIFTAFVMGTLPAGVRGAFVAAALAAGMSTLSAMLSSMGTVSLLDVWKLHGSGVVDERTWLWRARLLTLFWALFSFGAAMVVLQFGTVITAGIKLGSILSGGLFGMFLLGMFFPSATSAGAIGGALAGICAVAAVMASTTISWSWYCLIGTAITVFSGYCISGAGRGYYAKTALANNGTVRPL
ncbi:MAG: sodium/solute symporter [Acidobacteria bacterium]|nr:sodium/solute symporter [Acidobacteriota bacterium]